jgi:ABC-type bacteriocin/lantibiotic exporter with double-glycine peptidase domain
VRINADFVENTLKKGSLSSPKEFNDFFLRQGILTKPRTIDIASLLEKSYLFPCAGIMKTGQAVILIGTKKSEDGDAKSILSIDPMDPTADVKVTTAKEFEDVWVGKIIMVAPKNDNASLDRTFDIDWFYPELSRFKGVLCLTFVMSLIIHALGIAPIIFIQSHLIKFWAMMQLQLYTFLPQQ